ncbi:MAG: hypothetical protein C4294_20360 [Nitrospiraceae bacterium]
MTQHKLFSLCINSKNILKQCAQHALDRPDVVEYSHVDLQKKNLSPTYKIAELSSTDFHYFFVQETELNDEICAFLCAEKERGRKMIAFVLSNNSSAGLELSQHVLVCHIPSAQVVHAVDLVSRIKQIDRAQGAVDINDVTTLIETTGICHMLVVPASGDKPPDDFIENIASHLKASSNYFGAFIHVPMPANRFDGPSLKRIMIPVRMLCHPDAKIICSYAGTIDPAAVLGMFFPYPH